MKFDLHESTVIPAIAAARVDEAFVIGMHQHRGEILPFVTWLMSTRHPLRSVIEIGTLHGGTAALWHTLSTGEVVTIDLPSGRFGGADHNLDEARCRERSHMLTQMYPRTHPVLGDSHDTATAVSAASVLTQPVDLLFIDGDHTYDGVKCDWMVYRDLVAPGGLVVFHDILDTPVHRAAGCEVDRLWAEIKGSSQYNTHEFSVNGPWGGIGVVEL